MLGRAQASEVPLQRDGLWCASLTLLSFPSYMRASGGLRRTTTWTGSLGIGGSTSTYTQVLTPCTGAEAAPRRPPCSNWAWVSDWPQLRRMVMRFSSSPTAAVASTCRTWSWKSLMLAPRCSTTSSWSFWGFSSSSRAGLLGSERPNSSVPCSTARITDCAALTASASASASASAIVSACVQSGKWVSFVDQKQQERMDTGRGEAEPTQSVNVFFKFNNAGRIDCAHGCVRPLLI